MALGVIQIPVRDADGQLVKAAKPVTLSLFGGTFSSGRTADRSSTFDDIAPLTSLRIDVAGSYRFRNAG